MLGCPLEGDEEEEEAGFVAGSGGKEAEGGKAKIGEISATPSPPPALTSETSSLRVDGTVAGGAEEVIPLFSDSVAPPPIEAVVAPPPPPKIVEEAIVDRGSKSLSLSDTSCVRDCQARCKLC